MPITTCLSYRFITKVICILLVLGNHIGWCAETTYDINKPKKELPDNMGFIIGINLKINKDTHGDVLITVLKQEHISCSLVNQSITFPVGAMSVQQVRDQTKDAVVVINGSFFDIDFKTLGLLKLNGAEHQPVSDKGLLSGIVGITPEKKLTLLTRDGDVAACHEAFQAGPYIIDPGGTLGVNPRPARASRTIIATNAQRDIIIVITKSFTLHEVATFMLEHPDVLGGQVIERALNLDGGPSTGFACIFPELNWKERGPVRNMIVFSRSDPAQ